MHNVLIIPSNNGKEVIIKVNLKCQNTTFIVCYMIRNILRNILRMSPKLRRGIMYMVNITHSIQSTIIFWPRIHKKHRRKPLAKSTTEAIQKRTRYHNNVYGIINLY